MKLNITLKNSCLAFAMTAMALLTGCEPDEVKSGNPLTEAVLDASFTATTTDGNNFTVKSSDDSKIQYHTWKWISTGEGATKPANDLENIGTSAMNFTFPTPGTYVLRHRVVGRTGGTNSVTEQTFVITTSALGPNVIKSPNFENASDWTVLNISGGNKTAWTFNTGSATISGADGQKAIYQAVQVKKGTYKFDMNVAGPGSVNTWFEVYISATAPTPETDYNAGGKRLQLNTWAGCATAPFNGLLSVVGCGSSADVSGPTLTFDQDGTVYFLVKCGSTGDGKINTITVSDVKLQKLG